MEALFISNSLCILGGVFGLGVYESFVVTKSRNPPSFVLMYAGLSMLTCFSPPPSLADDVCRILGEYGTRRHLKKRRVNSG